MLTAQCRRVKPGLTRAGGTRREHRVDEWLSLVNQCASEQRQRSRATLVVVATADDAALEAKRLIKISKYLSKHLRHQPERLGLTLEPGGWVSVRALLTACKASNFPISLRELDEVVAHNDKQRFSFDATRQKIRANQGHSIEIDLQLSPATPPPKLFHGTNARAIGQIWREGLLPMGRHHVHLSADAQTATSVGARRGKPVLLVVDSARMSDDGYDFFQSANGVWLVAAVPANYLSYAALN